MNYTELLKEKCDTYKNIIDTINIELDNVLKDCESHNLPHSEWDGAHSVATLIKRLLKADEKDLQSLQLLKRENTELRILNTTHVTTIQFLQQKLEKIREKCEKYDANVGDTIIANPIQDLYDILQIIEENA